MNLPNKLTILRICMIPLFILAYFLPYGWPWVSAIIFVLAAFTDFLDGHIARKRNLVTDFGKLLDPVADKILVTAALFCLVSSNPLQWLSYVSYSMANFDSTTFGIVFLTCGSAIILARELLIDGVRMVAASKGIVVQANIFGKIKTVLQDISIPVLICLNFGSICAAYAARINIGTNDVVYIVFWIVGVVLFALAVSMTIVSGVIYLIQNKSVFEDR